MVNDFSDENISDKKIAFRREVERAFGLPSGAVDKCAGDLLRIFRWRDEGDDPGPMTDQQRTIYGAKYFNELFEKRQLRGELIFRTHSEATRRLRDEGYAQPVPEGAWEKGSRRAVVVQTGIIYSIQVRDKETLEKLDSL